MLELAGRYPLEAERESTSTARLNRGDRRSGAPVISAARCGSRTARAPTPQLPTVTTTGAAAAAASHPAPGDDMTLMVVRYEPALVAGGEP
jgi:hypothetical protein